MKKGSRTEKTIAVYEVIKTLLMENPGMGRIVMKRNLDDRGLHVSNKTISKILKELKSRSLPEDGVEKADEKIEKLEKMNLLLTEECKSLKRQTKKTDMHSAMVDAIRESTLKISSLKPIPPVPIKLKGVDEEEQTAVLVYSDSHAGEVVSEEVC